MLDVLIFSFYKPWFKDDVKHMLDHQPRYVVSDSWNTRIGHDDEFPWVFLTWVLSVGVSWSCASVVILFWLPVQYRCLFSFLCKCQTAAEPSDATSLTWWELLTFCINEAWSHVGGGGNWIKAQHKNLLIVLGFFPCDILEFFHSLTRTHSHYLITQSFSVHSHVLPLCVLLLSR